MTYRVIAAFAIMFILLPFALVYSFQIGQPDHALSFTYDTWLSGAPLVLIVIVVFLSPGLTPFVGERYYGWVMEVTGITHTASVVQQRATHAFQSLPELEHAKSVLTPSSLKSKLVSLTGTARANWTKRRSGGVEASMPDVLSLENPSKSFSERLARPQIPIRSKIEETLSRLKSDDTKEKYAVVRAKLSNMFTPDERQREVVLNLYTLRIYSHMASALEMYLDLIKLEPALDGFARQVCAGIPVPPPPGSTEVAAPRLAYTLPPSYQEPLVDYANRANVPIKEADFEMAAAGDLERALLILKVILTRNDAAMRPDNSKHVDPIEELRGVL